MAGKKKKKAVNNPARGFMTVSQSSKPKIPDNVPEIEDGITEVGEMESKTLRHNFSVTDLPQHVKEEPSVKEMTPSDLEKHFEDAELQAMLESNAKRTKKEAARQVAKFETDRRVLRADALPLVTDDWLTEAVIEEIFSLNRTHDVEEEDRLVTPTNKGSFRQSDFLIELWTLQQVLEALDMPRIQEALTHVVGLALNSSPFSQESVWGLEESLDWLALSTSSQNLPDYNHDRSRLKDLGSSNSLPTSSTECSRSSSPLRIRNVHEINASASTQIAREPELLVTATGEVEETQRSNISQKGTGNDSSDDDDNSPEHLVDKFIAIKTKLFELENRSHDPTERLSDRSATAAPKAFNIMCLEKRLKAIEHDVLFDQSEAKTRWVGLLPDLHAGFARQSAQEDGVLPKYRQPRRGRKKEEEEEEDRLEAVRRRRNEDKKEEKEEEEDEEEEEPEDDDPLFGEMFTIALPGSAGLETVQPNQETDVVLLIDFGKWSGISPRRLLEETCRLRDHECKISFQTISSAAFSVRQRLSIYWAKQSALGVTSVALPPRVSHQQSSQMLVIAMDTISTPNVLQSEAYLSTIALFILTVGNPKEERIYLRFPMVWRDVWRDLLEQTQRKTDAVDKANLKLLRSVIAEQSSVSKTRQGQTSTTAKVEPEKGNRQSLIILPHLPIRADADTLRGEWTKKASTPQYRDMLEFRKNLPVFAFKEDIMGAISAQKITIVCADTGAGKSTQIPSFILEHELSAGRDCRILVTQPRRISAISLARRVSQELGETRGAVGTRQSLVGFAIRLESKISPSTRITYATTGVLLRMIENSPDLREITCLILDEVHERTLDLDLMFIAIRRLSSRRPDLKVILMSATVNAERFSNYFGAAPILNVPGRTYPVELRFLEDAIESTLEICNDDTDRLVEAEPESTDAGNDGDRVSSVVTGLDDYSAATRSLLAHYDEYRIDYQLITNIAAVISSHKLYSKYSRAILIFMPGMAEINRLHHIFLGHPSFVKGWSFFLLHSSFSTDDLEKAFSPPPFGSRKIVITTNIAETGITIPDITAVIDTCKEKTMRFDERRQISRLTEGFTSRSSCKQRRGRAARVQEGLCFHLVTRHRYEHLLPEEHVPEMLRLSLQEPILRVKIWDLGDIEETLGQALDPPSSKNVLRAIDALKDVGALTSSQSLTPLGRQLARLPLDIWLGKMVILGTIFECLDVAVSIASVMTSKSPFVVSNQSDGRAEKARRAFFRGNSDLLTYYNAYSGWRSATDSGRAKEFCRKNWLDQQTLRQIEDQKTHLLVQLEDAGLLGLKEDEKAALRQARISGRERDLFDTPARLNSQGGNEVASNSLIAMAFYPKLLVRLEKGWKNVFTNQQASLTPGSIYHIDPHPPRWLSFHQAMQTKTSNLKVSDTSAVPESAIVLLLGSAKFHLYAGVIAIDGGKVRFRVKDWRAMVALKILRGKMQRIVTQKLRSPGKPLNDRLQPWFVLWQRTMNRPMQNMAT